MKQNLRQQNQTLNNVRITMHNVRLKLIGWKAEKCDPEGGKKNQSIG